MMKQCHQEYTNEKRSTEKPSPKHLKVTQQQLKQGKRLEMLIEELGLSSNAIIAEKQTLKSNLTSTKANVTSATINATVVIVKRFCHLMNTMGGRVVLLNLLNVEGVAKDINSGNGKSSIGIKSVYGVVLQKYLKLTISKGGALTRNCVINYPMVGLSV